MEASIIRDKTVFIVLYTDSLILCVVMTHLCKFMRARALVCVRGRLRACVCERRTGKYIFRSTGAANLLATSHQLPVDARGLFTDAFPKLFNCGRSGPLSRRPNQVLWRFYDILSTTVKVRWFAIPCLLTIKSGRVLPGQLSGAIE